MRIRLLVLLPAVLALGGFAQEAWSHNSARPAHGTVPPQAVELAQATPGQGMAGQGMMGQGFMGPGLMMPAMDPIRGRMLFASKGCVVCHSINGIGGEDAPALDAATMPGPMNPFDFAAKMWRGAEAMINMQKEELGAQIEFTGDELADIIAFVHSPMEQKKFSEADIPHHILDLMHHMGEDMDKGHMMMNETEKPKD